MWCHHAVFAFGVLARLRFYSPICYIILYFSTTECHHSHFNCTVSKPRTIIYKTDIWKFDLPVTKCLLHMYRSRKLLILPADASRLIACIHFCLLKSGIYSSVAHKNRFFHKSVFKRSVFCYYSEMTRRQLSAIQSQWRGMVCFPLGVG